MFHMPSTRRFMTPGAAPAAARRFPVLAGVIMAGSMLAVALAPHAARAKLLASHPLRIAQEEAPEDASVSADQIKKYIAVYSAMQRDHSLTVADAASKQGLTVDQFRAIEDRIERNPVAHERVLDALKKASKKAQPNP